MVYVVRRRVFRSVFCFSCELFCGNRCMSRQVKLQNPEHKSNPIVRSSPTYPSKNCYPIIVPVLRWSMAWQLQVLMRNRHPPLPSPQMKSNNKKQKLGFPLTQWPGCLSVQRPGVCRSGFKPETLISALSPRPRTRAPTLNRQTLNFKPRALHPKPGEP